jgi:hypothetical protein
MKKCFISVIITGVVFLSVQLTGCDKKNDDFASDALTDYTNLQTGKYIIYRLDSTRYDGANLAETVVSYLAKDTVEGPATDNLGRAGWRVVRYLRDINSTSDNDWQSMLTYHVIPSRENIEVNEENFRFLKLTLPIKEGRSWRGNGYLPDNPYESIYEFSNDEDMQDWEYTYQDVGASVTINNKNYDSTITVVQIADSTNLPIQPNIPASKTYWVEKYAKGIGLVFKEVYIWEYQPPTNVPAYKQGFAIKMTIIDHN